MQIFLMIGGYLALGAVQFFAIISGVQALGVHWVLSGLLALFLAYMPIVGTAAGVYGAVTAWGWSLTHALALFVGPLVVAMILALLMMAAESRGRRA